MCLQPHTELDQHRWPTDWLAVAAYPHQFPQQRSAAHVDDIASALVSRQADLDHVAQQLNELPSPSQPLTSLDAEWRQEGRHALRALTLAFLSLALLGGALALSAARCAC